MQAKFASGRVPPTVFTSGDAQSLSRVLGRFRLWRQQSTSKEIAHPETESRNMWLF